MHEYKFQAARYDGDLQGTEVGMVLFYTDLLAKLWALDYMDNNPDRTIEDFVNMTDIALSPVYRKEVDSLSNTRLWFGHEDGGFQVGPGDKSLFFSRNATRVYAASSNPLRPGQEATANAHSSAYLGWWNDHYDEVARYEPEYERLNQIMKWSLMIGWLNEKGRGDVINFLGAVEVDRSNRFPSWARAHAELRFRHWSAVDFYPQGYKGTSTESLPMLVSDPYRLFGETTGLSGGVSLASRKTFASRAAVSKTVRPAIRRSRMDYGTVGSNGRTFKTLDGVTHELPTGSAGRASTVSTPAQGAKLRGRHGEITPQAVRRNISRDSRGITFQTQSGEAPIGDLLVTRNQNGLAVAWKSRDLDLGFSLARRISRSRVPERVLIDEAAVESAIRMQDGSYVVQLRGSQQWLKIGIEQPSVSIGKGWQSRVADPNGSMRNIQLAWVERADVQAQLDLVNNHLVRESVAGTDKQILAIVRGRPPPGHQSPPVENALRGSRGAVEPKGLVQNLASGDYRGVARRMAGDAQGVKRALDQDLTSRLSLADELMRTGQSSEARRVLTSLRDTYGADPRVLLRSAVNDLQQGQVATAARNLEALGARSRPDRLAFYDEVNRRLAEPRLATVERNNLNRLLDYAEGIGQEAGGSGRLRPVADGENLVLHYEIDNLSSASRIQPSQLGDVDPTRVYASPGLNNLDWAAPTTRTLDRAVSDGVATIHRIRSQHAVLVPPDAIRVVQSDARFISLRELRGLRVGRPSSSDNCESESDPACEYIYVIVETSAGTGGASP